jgi:hypothetical protein
MANARLSTLAAQFAVSGNQAAMATAIGGGIVASDIAALAAVMTTLSLSPDISINLIGQSTTPALAATMLQPS